jgi:hypothetical protein
MLDLRPLEKMPTHPAGLPLDRPILKVYSPGKLAELFQVCPAVILATLTDAGVEPRLIANDDTPFFQFDEVMQALVDAGKLRLKIDVPAEVRFAQEAS